MDDSCLSHSPNGAGGDAGDVQTEEAKWEAAVASRWPRVYAVAQGCHFPDTEKDSRHYRSFMPWAALHCEMEAIAANKELLKAVNALLEDNLPEETSAKDLAVFYEVINYVIATKNKNWIIELIASCSPASLSLFDTNDIDPSDSSYLAYAVVFGNVKLLAKLLNDARLDVSNAAPHILFAATIADNTPQIREALSIFLRDPRVDPSFNNYRIVLWAASVGNTDILEILLRDTRVDPSVINNLALPNAVLNGHAEVVQMLLGDPRVDPSAPELLLDAVQRGNSEVVRVLLSDKRLIGNVAEALKIAAEQNNKEMLKSLFIAAITNISPQDIFLWACGEGSVHLAQYCLSECEDKSVTLRSKAARRRRVAAGESPVTLLAAGESPVIDPSMNDNAAIITAAARGYTEVVHFLLSDSRVDPSAQNNAAIRQAAAQGRAEVVALLLNAARVNPADEDNEAIRHAALRGHTEVVRLLLTDPRVDPSSRNNYAVERAFQGRHAAVLRLLLGDTRIDPIAILSRFR